MKRLTLAVLIIIITALFVLTSGCTYQTGGQNATQNGTQNASHVQIRLPLLPNVFGNTTNSLTTISSQLTHLKLQQMT